MLYPENFEEKLGFVRIREQLKGLCLSDLGRRKVDRIKFSTKAQFIHTLIGQVEEFRQIELMEETFPLQHFIDVTPWLKKVKPVGTFLQEEEIFGIRRSLDTIRALLRFFKKRQEEEKYPLLQKLSARVKLYPYIFERIDQILNAQGKIKDSASPELAQIRREMREKEAAISRRLQAILGEAKKAGYVDAGTTLAVRDGRAVIPIDAGSKRKIKGVVLDESATGRTAYIEPQEILDLNNLIKELGYAERREMTRILALFTDDIRPYIDELLWAYDYMGTIDFIRAKARFALKVNGIKPIFSEKPVIHWFEAVHPLLYLSFKKEGKQVVPLEMHMEGPDSRILLISGPNAGGKSVCLQTVGLLQYMFQCGLLVPARETSEFGIFQKLFLNIGDDQSIDNDLSTYSSHLLNMKNFLRHANNRSLVLIDEFGSGTEPLLGGAIAEAMLEELNSLEVMGVITTHYANLKHLAGSAKGIKNAAMLFDTGKIEPLFKLSIGEPGSSFAFEIARKIGLPEHLLKRATEKVGEDHILFDRNLKDILRDKKYWEEKREKVRQSEKHLEKILAEYDKELGEAKKLRQETLSRAKEEAKELLGDVNKRIENTISEIRKNQADKNSTRKIRQDMETFKEKVNTLDEKEDARIRRKMEKLKAREQRVKKHKTPKDSAPAAPKKELPLEAGAKVRIQGQSTIGEVLEVNGDSILIAMGSLYTTVNRKKLEVVSEQAYASQNRKSENVQRATTNFEDRKIHFKSEIDVRGLRADEALQKVSEFIDEAIVVRMSRLRILHGKGNGILRQLIREYLQGMDLVRSFRDEHLQFGGSGITVVELDV
ncbi:MAG: Smr/MutS family protein [Bacteroidales bacterium]